jgi:hypothetical protein
VPVIPDLPWTAEHLGDGRGVVMVTHLHLHLRRPRDVPAFFRDSLAIRAQAAAALGARSLYLRALPLARHSTTVSWWDDQAAVVAFVRADPHRSAMRRRGPRCGSSATGRTPAPPAPSPRCRRLLRCPRNPLGCGPCRWQHGRRWTREEHSDRVDSPCR